MDQCRVPLRDIQQLQKLEVALHDQIQGKVETNTFCHQIPKLFQEKGETVSDFAKRCITEMWEFIDSIDKPADDQFDADYLAHNKPSTETPSIEWLSMLLPKDVFWWESIKASKSHWYRRIQLHSPNIEILNIERECSKIVLTKPLSLFQLGSCFHNTVYLVTFHPQFLLDM